MTERAAVLTYPVTLPCVSRVDGPSAVAYAGVVRTPMEAGNARQRRAQRVLPHRLALSFDIAHEELAAWLVWCNENAWGDFFLLALPGLLASRAGTATASVPVRFVSDVTRELWQGRGLWGWHVRVEAEYQPTAADLGSVPIGPWIVAGAPATPSPDWIIAGTPASPAVDTITAGTPATPSALA
jgi:hypothetical protein